MIAEELAGLEKEVNEDIYSFCEQYAQEAEQRAAEYRHVRILASAPITGMLSTSRAKASLVFTPATNRTAATAAATAVLFFTAD